jgi:peroxiredoxin
VTAWAKTTSHEKHAISANGAFMKVGRKGRVLVAKWLSVASILVWLTVSVSSAANAETPEVGSKAPDFTLSTPEGAQIHFADLIKKGKVVLVLLRGFPGYQCPYCQKQAHDFQLNAPRFAQAGAHVLLVYPGPPADLGDKAKEFLAKQGELPDNFNLVIDPDYKFTNQYGLRWDAPHETAYPSTFIVGRDGVILYRKISHSHGDRSSATDVLAELEKEK